MGVDLRVGDRWLNDIGPAGDLTWTTRWPGGLYEITWTMTLPEGRRLPGMDAGTLVQLRDGALSLGWAKIQEPNWAPADAPGLSTATFVAKGISEQAAGFMCTDGSGAGTSVADTAIDAAIGWGWNALRRTSFSTTPLTGSSTTTQSSPLPSLLTGVADLLGESWGIDQDRYIFHAPNLVGIDFHIPPGQVDVGLADDNVVTDLFVNYINSATGLGDVEIVHDATTYALYGEHKSEIVDAIGLGPIATAQAHALGVGVFAKVTAAFGWTSSLTLTSSQLRDAGNNPANLDQVAAHMGVRVHGLFDHRTQMTYTDTVIGECTRTRGADTVTISAMGAVARTLEDVIEKILKDAAAKAFQA